MSRLAIFVDGGYLAFGLKDEFGSARIDFAKLSVELSQGREVLRTYYYHCLPYQSNPPTPDEKTRFGRMQAFINRLDRLPRFSIRLGKLAWRGTKEDGTPIFVQKRVDILLGVDLVLLSAKAQITDAVLIAGDSDFLPAVEVARREGIVVHLYSFSQSQAHRDLWAACDERTIISKAFVDKILLY